MNSKETLVVICRSLFLGGIETCAIAMMRNALEKGRRVIWVGDISKPYSSNYREIIENKEVEFVPHKFSQFDLYNLSPIIFQKNEIISFVTFGLVECYISFRYRKEYLKNNIQLYYIIPHFTGSNIYIEQSVWKFFQKPISKVSRNIYKELYDNGSLYFFSDTHHEALEKNYHISLPSAKDKVVRNLSKQIAFSIEQRQAIYRNKRKFTIISAGRFEFPHKGFLVGLVKEFANLSVKYPQLELLIIGEGAGKETLDELIHSLPEPVQKKIFFKAPVSPEKLVEIMLECDLNISVAGCASLGAKAGVLTLPARHYTYDCEVYGFIPECAGKFTSSEPGYPVSDYIEKAINMTEEEYIAECEKNHMWFNQNENEANLDYPFGLEQNVKYYPSIFYFTFIRFIYFIKRLCSLVQRIHIS